MSELRLPLLLHAKDLADSRYLVVEEDGSGTEEACFLAEIGDTSEHFDLAR